MSDLDLIARAPRGMWIGEAAQRAREIADATQRNLRVEFNGALITVKPGQRPEKFAEDFLKALAPRDARWIP